MLEFTRKKHIERIQYLDTIEQQSRVSPKMHCLFYMDANLIDLDFDTPVYRIFQWNKFLDLIKNKRLCLVKPSLWDDPFENFILKAKGKLNDGRVVEFDNIRNQFYGACWTLKDECDGLWRNYTNSECKKCSFCKWLNRHGNANVSVKVKTTVGKLMSAFYDMDNPFHSLCYWIGKVEYLSDKQITEALYNGFKSITDNTGVDIVRTLLIKRKAFEYEQEVRMIFMRPDNSSGTDFSKVNNKWNSGNLFFLKVDPHNLIDEIEFDPWCDPQTYQDKINELGGTFIGRVKQSGLYNEPFFQIKV